MTEHQHSYSHQCSRRDAPCNCPPWPKQSAVTNHCCPGLPQERFQLWCALLYTYFKKKTWCFSVFSHCWDWTVRGTESEVAVWTRYMYWPQFTVKKPQHSHSKCDAFWRTDASVLFLVLGFLFFFSIAFHQKSLLRFRILHGLIKQQLDFFKDISQTRWWEALNKTHWFLRA